MKYIFIFLMIIAGSALSFSQNITTLPSLPEPVSNNAVTSATVNGTPYIYSFSGIDSTKIWSGVHTKSYRMNMENQIWERIPDLPAGPGRIGAAASTVKNKIYIIGGYDVAQNGDENTLPYVHIYDPETNTYLEDGTSPDVLIDDHVQVVYKDSLIFAVSGWSQNQNVGNIQIYNPQENTWSQATSIPNNSNDYVFGGSGTIVGDTLYYLGGAANRTGFPPANRIRKLWINPDNPTEIEFDMALDNRGRGYRMGATTLSDRAVWIGGAQNTYNFDGIAYDGSGPVSANTSTRIIDPNLDGELTSTSSTIPPTMDLRGVAKLNEQSVAVVGGMADDQTVTARVYQIDFDFLSTSTEINTVAINIHPNPTKTYLYFDFDYAINIRIHDIQGKFMHEYTQAKDQINVDQLKSGAYIFMAYDGKNLINRQNFIIE